MAQETSSHTSWAFFLFASPAHVIPPHTLPSPLSFPIALSFCLAWWQCCHCLAILESHPFPPHEQLLTAVVLSAVVVAIIIVPQSP